MALFGIALSFAALLSGAVSPPDKPDPASDVTVRFYDLVGVPAETILAMQATTAAALAPAGISIQWAVCADDDPRPAACAEPEGRDVVVRLIETHDARKPACGFAMAAPGGGGFVSLSDTCVGRTVSSLMRRSTLASRGPGMAGSVTGYFLAHELAHILLPGTAHSRAGLFRARLGRDEWRSLERGALAFLPEDVALLRESLQGAAQRHRR